MTSPDVLKLKMIQALIEGLDDMTDEDDAKQAIKMIKNLIGEPKQN